MLAKAGGLVVKKCPVPPGQMLTAIETTLTLMLTGLMRCL